MANFYNFPNPLFRKEANILLGKMGSLTFYIGHYKFMHILPK